MQGKTKTTFINQSELEQRLNNQIKPTSFRLISGLEYTEAAYVKGDFFDSINFTIFNY